MADNHIIPADGIGRPDQQQVPDPSAPRDAAEAARLAAEAAGRECLDAALDYLARGWSSLAICPPDHYGVGRAHAKNCSSPGKAPWGEWKAFQARLPTEAELRRKWADNPQLNVGLALGGMTGLVGLDIDGQPGEALLVELAQGDLPPTLEFTSGKGRRLLYRVPPGVSLRPTPQPGGLKVEGGELRLLGTGSQTVMPPSRHRDSGRRYRWVPGRGPGEIDPAPAPAWVVGLMRADGPRRARGPRPGPAPASNGEAHVAGDAIPEGQRDVRLTSLAGTLRRRGLGHDAILAALAALNETCCTPPLDEAQVAKIASSVSGYSTSTVDAGGAPSTGEPVERTVYRTIRQWWESEYLCPVWVDHGRDAVWSRTQRRLVSQREECRAGRLGIAERLLSVVPQLCRDRSGEPTLTGAMALYRRWAPVAWSEMVASLPAEADSPEVDELAEEEFRRRLAGALTRLVQLRVRAGEDQDEAPQSRALIDWCRWYARSERWARVRSHRAWGALAPGDGLAATRLRVAIRAEVLTQIGAADLAHLGQRRLAQLCELYGVGQRVRVSHGGTHAVELDPEWVAELLAPEGST